MHHAGLEYRHVVRIDTVERRDDAFDKIEEAADIKFGELGGYDRGIAFRPPVNNLQLEAKFEQFCSDGGTVAVRNDTRASTMLHVRN